MTTLALFIAVLALVIATGTAWFCVRELHATSKRIDALRDSLDRRIGHVETSIERQKKPPAKKRSK